MPPKACLLRLDREPVTETVRTVTDLRLRVASWRHAGESVALVPTMGALHDGHMALLAAARTRSKRVVVSIFVNPTQFAPADDFALYPRREADDLAMLAQGGADLLYAPTDDAMYPTGFATEIHPFGPLVVGLEAVHRPGHFAGVATVVGKLLLQMLPNAAYFGEKDYQQLQIIRRLADDLDIPVEIVGVPIVRDADGLALSSRNAYLSRAERRQAAMLPDILRRAASAIALGADICATLESGCAELLRAGFDPIDYLAVCDAATLEPMTILDHRPARLLVAARIGRTRLLDNLPLLRQR